MNWRCRYAEDRSQTSSLSIRYRTVSERKEDFCVAKPDLSTSLDVIVVDAQRQFVEYVSTAVARVALRSHRARIIIKTPFTIQLAPGLHHCPRPERRSASKVSAPEIIHVQRQKGVISPMATKNPVAMTREIDAYLKTNPDEVWAKATTDMQVVLSSRKKGETLGINPIEPGDPVLLTRYATVEELKNSDLRHMVMQGKLRLMSSDDAEAYFAAKAKRLNATPDRLKAEALQRESAYANHEPANSGDNRKADQRAADIMKRTMPTSSDGGGMQINPELTRDVVKPRIVHLCRQASSQLKQEDRKPANLLLEEFLAIEDSLSMDDLEYIIANVAYKTVRSWATNRQAILSGEVIEDSESEAPVETI